MACESPVYVSLQSFEVSQVITAFPRKSRVIKDIGSFTYIVTVQLNGGDVSLKLQLTGKCFVEVSLHRIFQLCNCFYIKFEIIYKH